MDKFYILSEIGGWGVWPSEVQNFLQQNRGKDVEIYLNTPGGYIDDGMAIYNMLRMHTGKVTTIAIGVAASMGSVVFMAGDIRKIATGANIMIHKPSLDMWGTADDLRKGADYLDVQQKAIMDVYLERTGGAREVIEPLVNAETWMGAEQALALGFATVEQPQFSAVASAVRHDLTKFKNTPQALLRGNTPEGTNTAAPEPKAQTNKPEGEPKMELNKATAADVKKENSTLFSEIAETAVNEKREEIAAQAVKVERERIAGIKGLAKCVEGAPEKVVAAAKAKIEELCNNPEATAQNSAAELLKIVAGAQAMVEDTVGKGARELAGTAEVTGKGEDQSPDQAEEQERANRVSGMAQAFKNKRAK